MRRRSRYSDEVIAFSVTERRRGVKWKQIVSSIRQHFGIKPPTERQMRKWFDEYGADETDPEKLLKENLVKVARATTPVAAFATQKYVIEQVPALVEAWKQGKDPWIAGGVMMLTTLEQTVGTEKFNQILEEYRKTRKEMIPPAMAEENPNEKGESYQRRNSDERAYR